MIFKELKVAKQITEDVIVESRCYIVESRRTIYL